MAPSSSRARAAACLCGRVVRTVLCLAVMAAATGWRPPAFAQEAVQAANGVDPSFDLPPIMVNIPAEGAAHAKTIVLKTALVFDEVDEERITDSQRLAKALLPKIMDYVITGVQGNGVKTWSDTAEVSRVILERCDAILKPYGVLIKTLRVETLGSH